MESNMEEKQQRVDELIDEIGSIRYKINEYKKDIEKEEDEEELKKLKDELDDLEKDMACLTEELHKLYLEIRLELGEEEQDCYDGSCEVFAGGDY